jgi:hypothetical protein
MNPWLRVVWYSKPVFFAACLIWVFAATSALFAVNEPRPTTFLWAFLVSLALSLFERRWYPSTLFLLSALWFGWCFGWYFLMKYLAGQ